MRNKSRGGRWTNKLGSYACKTIPKWKVADDDEYIDLLKEEVANLERVRGHWHILQFVQAFEDASNVHIVTELLQGGDLYSKVLSSKKKIQKSAATVMGRIGSSSGGYFRDDDAAYMVRNILDALAYCHDEAGIVHRDLKASNFMFVRSSVGRNVRDIKIIDFGLSKRVDPETGRASGCLGTPYYVAPEVLTEESYTTKVDVWSIGVIAYLILSFDLPYQGKDEVETVHMLQDVDDHPPSYSSTRWKQLQRNEPEAVDFCKTLLRKDPNERPTAREAMNHPWIVKRCGGPQTPWSPSKSTAQTSTANANTSRGGEDPHHVRTSTFDESESLDDPASPGVTVKKITAMESIPETKNKSNKKKALRRWLFVQ